MALLAMTLAIGACRHAQVAVQVQTIDWRTSPLDLDLRGMNGKRYLFRCPPGKPVPASVIGSGVYADASSICAAAAHAGAIDAQLGGDVTIQILPGRTGYAGSTQNFIHSVDYALSWGGSFAVLSAQPADTSQND